MASNQKRSRSLYDHVELALRKAGLAWPEATEDFPWGHRTLKVRGKAFVFMGGDENAWTLSVKLPHSGLAALDLPFASPTGYGLGKSGWVTASFPPGEEPPVDLLLAWLRESYEAVAPRRLWAEAPKAREGAKGAGSEKKTPKTKSPKAQTAKPKGGPGKKKTAKKPGVKKPGVKKPAAKKPAAKKPGVKKPGVKKPATTKRRP